MEDVRRCHAAPRLNMVVPTAYNVQPWDQGIKGTTGTTGPRDAFSTDMLKNTSRSGALGMLKKGRPASTKPRNGYYTWPLQGIGHSCLRIESRERADIVWSSCST